GPKNAALRQNAPEIYQELSPGNRSRVEGRFVSAGAGEFKLELAAYQHAKPLIVDPVIEAASYVGGENEDEIVSATEGLVGGNTRSLSFPGAILALRRSRDMFLRGTGLLMPNRPNDAFFGTIVFGGSGDDELSAAVATRASSPQFLFAGVTKSTDFPVSDTSSYLGGASDGVVGGLSVSGLSHQVWSSYIGGSGEDRILSLTSGLSSYVIAGVTDSPNLPATNTLAGAKDGFVGAGSVFGGAASFQYVGGSADDSAYAVSLDNANRVWLGGETRSGDFPFNHGALQGSSDAFLASFRLPSFPSMVIDPLTFQRIGGSGDDAIRALAARRPTAAEDSSGVPLGNVPAFDGIGIAGVTTSTDLPVMNAAQGTLAGEQDIFVGMWGPADGLLWMTYVGGSGLEAATSIAQNWAGDLYVGGWTRSPDLSQVDAIQNGYAGGEDGLLAVFESRGKLSHLSYFGGSGDDRVNGVTLITNQVPRLVGSTTSADSPLTRSRTSRSEGMDGFIVDVGINHLIAPSSMVLAKDGMLSLNTLPGRTDLDLPITYRSSDPSRVRLVVDNRYYDEVTVIGGAVRVAALGDSGVVDLTATAEGYPVRTISVALYRGAFVPNTPALPISTWTPENTLFAPYQAIDPATGKPIGQSLALRPGMRAPVREWSVSDPSVMEIGVSRFGQPMLRALRPGEARVTLTVAGYEVVQVRDANLRAAHPQLAVQDFRL
ncbi:MAG TPA: hypothetical protein VER03_13950, partial [Bryobacteraceae bacterium]|nr:hypothetical protein [Bryobacteraceae bacterium]